jgi:hypothetical protein
MSPAMASLRIEGLVFDALFSLGPLFETLARLWSGVIVLRIDVEAVAGSLKIESQTLELPLPETVPLTFRGEQVLGKGA